MKRFSLFLTLVALLSNLPFFSPAQPGTWTWMKGNNSVNASGNYGTQGVADPANKPPADYAPATWTDLDGNFWIYGGAFNLDSYSDLWKFDPTTNLWTWVQGPGIVNQNPVYGTLGIPSPSNTPGARGFGVATWVSDAGDLWMYSGFSFFSSGFTDIWKYTISTNEWTWMGTYSYIPQHGQLQVASPANSPGDRSEMVATWKDDDGNFWFYGGQGGNGSYEDMWKYDVSINEWIWMHGDTTSGFNLQTYNTAQGQFDDLNSPGKRNIYSHWKDASGHFYIFAGGNPYFNLFSDLWEYDPAINQWAWVGGDATNFSPGNFTVKCDTDTLDYPRGVSENRACWTDHTGNFWMMGGEINSSYNVLNDLWVYVPARKDWVWVKGNNVVNQSGTYGTQGISDPANIPGGRFGTGSWIDNDCNLWLFGGATTLGGGFNYLNDLWKYVPDPSCIATEVCAVIQSPGILASSQIICEKFCVGFTDASTNNPVSWQWLFPGGTPSSSTDQNPAQVCYQAPGTYDVTLITTNVNGNDTLLLTDYITVNPTPPFPTITQNGFTLTSSPATNYQWQFNSVDIPGAIGQSYVIQQSGYYTVFITDSNGCSSSATVYILIEGIEDVNAVLNISIYPNPSNGSFMVELLNGSIADHASIEVYNTLGQVVFSSEEKINSIHFSKTIDLSVLPSGVYFLELTTGNDSKTDQLSVKKKLIMVK